MATLTLDTAQKSLLDAVDRERPRVADRPAPAAPADRATLDALVARSWSSLRVTRAAACLLCGGEVVPRYGSGPSPVGGTCRRCGTEIS